MDRLIRRYTMHVLGLALALIVSAAISAQAQQSLDLPQPQAQPTTRYQPPPPILPPSNNVQTIPAAPPPPPAVQWAPPPPPVQAPPMVQAPPPLAPQPVPVLPAVFRGCWRGRVDYLDDIRRLPGAPPTGLWMAKTYVLCYRRVGDGPFRLTFTDTGMEGTPDTRNTAGQMQIVSTDGRSYAKLRAMLRFDEYRKHAGFLENATFTVDETTQLQCYVEPDGMHVSGIVHGLRDGAPWFRAWWHARFVHVSSISE